jgi:S1-C subfamily serine protease
MTAFSFLFISARTVLARPEGGEKVYQHTVHGTVWILVPRNGGVTSGTGSLIDKTHRLVVTNYHVVGDATKVLAFFAAFHSDGKPISEKSYYEKLMSSGKAISGRVVERDEKRDLAILQLDSVPSSAQVIYLAKDGAGPGQTVHCLGNTGRSGALWGYTFGTVRSPAYLKKWPVRLGSGTKTFEARVIETQLPTNPGDSGGPLVNDRCELVAVTQGFAPDAQLLSLFIDVSEVKNFLRERKLLAKLPSPPPRGSSDETAFRPTNDKTETSVDPNREREKRAARNLDFAKEIAQAGKVDSAKKRYEKILSDFPDTKAAAEAKILLDKLEK